MLARRDCGLLNAHVLIPDIRSLQAGKMWDFAFELLWPIAYSAAFRRLEKIAPNDVKDIAVTAIREAATEVEDGKVESFEHLKGLVAEIARRRALDLIRRLRAGRRATGVTESVEGQEEILPTPDPGPRELANANDVAKLLTALMAKLSRERYELLRAYYFRGMKQREVSESSGKAPGTVAVELSRALKLLRKELEKYPELMKELLEELR